MRREVLVLVIASLFWPAIPAAAQSVLRYQFPDGRKSKTTLKVTLHQILTLNGQKHEISSEQEMAIAADNGIRDKEGDLRQRLKVESMKAKLTMPSGVVLEFDSSNPTAPRNVTQFDMFLDLIKVKANANWSVTRDKDNRVTSVDGLDKMLESLDQSKRELMKKQWDAEFLRDKANQEMLRVSSQPLSPNDTWELTESMRLDAGQNLKFKNKFTYQGVVERDGRKLHQIDMMTTEATYSMDSDVSSQLKLISSKLHPKTIDGVLYFDAEQGQVVESRESVQITGDVKFSLSGNELAGQIDLTIGTSSVVQSP